MNYQRLALLILVVFAIIFFVEETIKKSRRKRNKELKDSSQTGFVSVGVLDSERQKLLDKDKNGKVSITEQFTIPEDEVHKKILENDNTFSKYDFTSWSSALITCLFNAWNNNDLGTIKLYVTNNYFIICRDEIDEMMSKKQYHIRNIEKVKGLLLKDYSVENNIEILKVAITFIMKDYIINEKEKTIKNSRYDDYEKPLLITFIREKGVKSKYDGNVGNCPNCGAVLKPNLKATCDYCGVSVNSGRYNWAIDNIEDINI